MSLNPEDVTSDEQRRKRNTSAVGEPKDGKPHDTAVQSALSPVAEQMAQEILATHRVGRGAAATVLLVGPDGVMFSPYERRGLFHGYLETPERFAIIRALRSSEQAVQLNELPYKTYGQGILVDRYKVNPAGWYWRVDAQDSYVCATSDSLTIDVRANRMHAWPMAYNNSSATWESFVGAVTSKEFVWPQTYAKDSFDVTVVCPPGVMREFTVLVKTQERDGYGRPKGLALVSFRVNRMLYGAYSFELPPPNHTPPYYVVYDKNSKPRIYEQF